MSNTNTENIYSQTEQPIKSQRKMQSPLALPELIETKEKIRKNRFINQEVNTSDEVLANVNNKIKSKSPVKIEFDDDSHKKGKRNSKKQCKKGDSLENFQSSSSGEQMELEDFEEGDYYQTVKTKLEFQQDSKSKKPKISFRTDVDEDIQHFSEEEDSNRKKRELCKQKDPFSRRSYRSFQRSFKSPFKESGLMNVEVPFEEKSKVSIFDIPEFQNWPLIKDQHQYHFNDNAEAQLKYQEEHKQKLQSINTQPDLEKMFEQFATKESQPSLTKFTLKKHLAMPLYRRQGGNSKHQENQIDCVLEEDSELDQMITQIQEHLEKYKSEKLMKQRLSYEQEQYESVTFGEQRHTNIVNENNTHSSSENKNSEDTSLENNVDDNEFNEWLFQTTEETDESDEGENKIGSSSNSSSSSSNSEKKHRNEYQLSRADFKELFLLYCSKGYSPETACMKARVPIKCAKRWICNLTPQRVEGGGRKVMDNKVEQKLRLWVLLKLYLTNKFPSRDEQINYAQKQQSEEEFKCSKGWLEKYLDRNLIKYIMTYLRNIGNFQIKEATKFFVVIPSNHECLDLTLREVYLTQHYLKLYCQPKSNKQEAFIPGTAVNVNDLVIPPMMSNVQNLQFEELQSYVDSTDPEKRWAYSEPLIKHFRMRQNEIKKEYHQQTQNIKPNMTSMPLNNLGFPDLSKYVTIIQKANTMRSIEQYIKGSENTMIQEKKDVNLKDDNKLNELKLLMINKLKNNPNVKTNTYEKLNELYHFDEFEQEQLEMQQQAQQEEEYAKIQPKKRRNYDEVKNQIEEKDMPLDIKIPLPKHVRLLLKLNVKYSRLSRIEQRGQNFEIHDQLFQIELRYFYQIILEELKLNLKDILPLFKFKF